MGPLSEETLSRYERDGFLWLEGFLSMADIAPFLEELRELANDETLMRQTRTFRPGPEPTSSSYTTVLKMTCPSY